MKSGLTEVMTKNLGRDMKESLTLLGSGAGTSLHGFSHVSGVAGVVRRGRVETSSHCGDVWQLTQHRFDVSQLLRVFTGSPTGCSSVHFIPWLLS